MVRLAGLVLIVLAAVLLWDVVFTLDPSAQIVFGNDRAPAAALAVVLFGLGLRWLVMPRRDTSGGAPAGANRPRRIGRGWIVVAAICLALAYPLASGPAHYAAARHWVSRGTVEHVFRPVWRAANAVLPDHVYLRWREWWIILAHRHMKVRPFDRAV